MKRYLVLGVLLAGLISLTACSEIKDTGPVVENMPQTDVEKYESIIQKYDQKIKDFKPREFTEEELKKIDAGEEVVDPTTPNIDWFIEKSNAEKMLGRNTEAIKTLEESLKYFETSTVSWNNLGAIYVEAGDCGNASKYYSKAAEHFGGQRGASYFMEIAKCHYREDQKNKVLDAVNLFEEMGGTTVDPEIKDYLEKK